MKVYAYSIILLKICKLVKHSYSRWIAYTVVNEVKVYLGEVANEMASFYVVQGQHVEEKRFDIVVKSFVVQKQLGK